MCGTSASRASIVFGLTLQPPSAQIDEVETGAAFDAQLPARHPHTVAALDARSLGQRRIEASIDARLEPSAGHADRERELSLVAACLYPLVAQDAFPIVAHVAFVIVRTH